MRSLIPIRGIELIEALDLAAEGGAVGCRERLPVMFRLFRDHDAVDENPRDLDLARVQAAAVGEALDLNDDDAARVAHRHGDGEGFQRQGFPLHCDIPLRVRGRAPDNPDGDRKRLVE